MIEKSKCKILLINLLIIITRYKLDNRQFYIKHNYAQTIPRPIII